MLSKCIIFFVHQIHHNSKDLKEGDYCIQAPSTLNFVQAPTNDHMIRAFPYYNFGFRPYFESPALLVSWYWMSHRPRSTKSRELSSDLKAQEPTLVCSKRYSRTQQSIPQFHSLSCYLSRSSSTHMVKMSYDGDDLCDHLHLSYSPASKSSPPEPS